MRIDFSAIGKQLLTRAAGTAVRDQIVQGILADQFIVFDLSGVEIVSNSFADECFAKLLLDFDLSKIKKHTTFQQASHSSALSSPRPSKSGYSSCQIFKRIFIGYSCSS